jgi:diadenosine tetraphosphate (Ap4A) HIT family hydrolase
MMTCELCEQDGGEIIHRGAQWRVVLVDDPDHPGFCRVIWNGHVQEMTDLPAAERALLMDAVWQVEFALREVMRPDKINLASLGNMVPHLHWHIIPRYVQDAHFPAPVWAAVQRESATEELAKRRALLPALRTAIALRLG